MTRLILGALIAALILAPVTAGIVLFDGAGAAAAAWQTPYSDNFNRADSPLDTLGRDHDGAQNAAVLDDSGVSWSTDVYAGLHLYNLTDGSDCVVASNTATTATCEAPGLENGTGNDWDKNDTYTMNIGQNWTEAVGNPFIVSNEVDWFRTTGTGGVALWDTNTVAAKQCSCVKNATTINTTFCGPAVRYNDLTSSTAGYVARWTTSSTVVLRSCTNGSSCTTFETWSNAIDENNWLCLCVDGAGTSTEFALWERTTDPSAEDPTDWGDAGHCVCGSDTSCSLWTDCTATSAEDSTPTRRDCSGDDCYCGIYNGDPSSSCEQEDWSCTEYK